MEFEITHTTRYKYGHPAAEAYGEARLRPPDSPSQTVVNHRLTIDPDVKASGYTDHFGNHVDFYSLPFRHRHLVIVNQATVRTHPAERPAESLDLRVGDARQILGSAMPDIFEYLQPTRVVPIGRDALVWANKYLGSRASIGEGLQRLNEAIHTEFKYQSGSTENSTPLAAIWKSKTGVCQDFAHIMLSIVRTAGLPARYVCGYIETDPPRSGARLTGAVATHAWIETLVPGMRWVALDPTNRQWVGERHVAVSVGRDYTDATPLRGTFKGSGGQVMRVRVVMKRRNGTRIHP